MKIKKKKKEKTGIDKARELLQKDLEIKGKKCKEEIEVVLKKYGFNVQPISTESAIRQFINVISTCGINLVPRQENNKGGFGK